MWPVIAVVIGVAQLFLLLDTKSGSEVYVPVAGTSTTTTITPGSTIKTPWGSVTSASFKVEDINTCKDFTFDLQVTDLAPIGDPNKFIELKGVSGYLFAVTGVTLRVGSNPVTFTLEADNILYVKVASWLNETEQPMHLEPTIVLTYNYVPA